MSEVTKKQFELNSDTVLYSLVIKVKALAYTAESTKLIKLPARAESTEEREIAIVGYVHV